MKHISDGRTFSKKIQKIPYKEALFLLFHVNHPEIAQQQQQQREATATQQQQQQQQQQQEQQQMIVKPVVQQQSMNPWHGYTQHQLSDQLLQLRKQQPFIELSVRDCFAVWQGLTTMRKLMQICFDLVPHNKN